MSTVIIHLADPRGKVVEGRELGTLRAFMRGDPRRPWPALLIAKPRGGTAQARKEVAHG